MQDQLHDGARERKGTSLDDEEWMHPWVREAIHSGERDKPLTLNSLPAEPDMLDCLRLPKLPHRATTARSHIIAEALAAGDHWVSYSRRRQHYAARQRYYRSAYTYDAIVPTVDQLAAEGLL